MKKNPVVHFEMPYDDASRVAKFYMTAFGWDMNDTGDSMGNYVIAVTADTENSMNKVPGTINGGFYPRTKSTNPYPSFVISVENINDAMEEVKKAGGKIFSEPQEIPGIGMWAVF